MANHTAVPKKKQHYLMQYYRRKTYITRDALKSQFRWSEPIIDYFLQKPDKISHTKSGLERREYMFIRVEEVIRSKEFKTRTRADKSQRLARSRTVKKNWHDKRKIEKMDAGICAKCTEKIMLNSMRYCEKHHFRMIAKNAVMDANRWVELKALLENQNYKCALTGDTIVVGINDSVDHIIPKIKFQDTSKKSACHDLSNIRWLTRLANEIKTRLTDEELMDFFNKIINYKKLKEESNSNVASSQKQNNDVFVNIANTRVSAIKMSGRLRLALKSEIATKHKYLGIKIHRNSPIIDVCKISESKLLKLNILPASISELKRICQKYTNSSLAP